MEHTAHRPYPPKTAPWVMSQAWERLLFAHWRIAPAIMAHLIPPGVQLDLFDGSAWVGVVPFRMNDVTLRFVPPFPPVSRFLELNVRTYVRSKTSKDAAGNGRPGVLFFSLDCSMPPAVEAARTFFHLPYFHAKMNLEERGEQTIYSSRRVDSRDGVGTSAPPHAVLDVSYRPDSPVFKSQPDSIERFLTERYCLFTSHGGNTYRAEIHHEQWTLQTAEAEFRTNTMLDWLNLKPLEPQPLLHYCERIPMVNWLLERD